MGTVLTPILSSTKGTSRSYNVGMAETYSWIPVEGEVLGRPLYAQASYITNFSDMAINLSASELSIGAVTIKDNDSGRNADVVAVPGYGAGLQVLTQDLESSIDDVTIGDKNSNYAVVDPALSSLQVKVTNLSTVETNQQTQITLLEDITAKQLTQISQLNTQISLQNILTAENLYGTLSTLPLYVQPSQSYPNIVELRDSPQLDAFGRLRVSQPTTLFDSKSLYDKGRFFWNFRQRDGQELFLANDSSLVASITANGGYYIKETYRRFPYQPGKSQLLLFTGVLSAETDIIKRVGVFTSLSGNDYNDNTVGIYFEAANNDYAWVIRNNSNLVPSQSATQAQWNLDKMDGAGPSGITLDFSKSQIFVMDYEWLGVGRVRCGFNVDGVTRYCHQFLHANNITGTYMTDCNLPIRAELRSTGASSGSMKTICASIMSEGGAEDPSFVTRAVSMSSSVSLQPTDGRRGLLGIRLNPLRTNSANEIVDIGIFPQVNQQNTFAPFKWQLVLRPTPAAGVNWTAFSVNSNMQYAQGSDALTITEGEVVAEGFGSRDTKVTLDLPIFDKCLKLGRNLDGIPDEFWIVVTSLQGDNPFWCTFTIGESD